MDQPGGDDAANSAGATSVFERDELGSWIVADILHTADRAGSDSFGVRVAIDGDTVIVGAHANDDDGDNSGSAYLFQPDLAVPGSWLEVDLA